MNSPRPEGCCSPLAEPFYPIAAAAASLRIDARKLACAVNTGTVRSMHVNGRAYVRLADVLAAIDCGSGGGWQ